MTGRIQQEIRQSKPMPLPVEAHLNLQRTATAIRALVEETTSSVGGLKQSEYNVLRILRGAGPDGLTTEQVRDRLLAPDPMLPAVLGALANRGLIERHEQRRTIAQAGLDALAALDQRVDAVLAERMGRLSEAELRALIDALERLRD
jgi:MarR family transcriptional regulator, organic hydroperoxide resistance regulator